MSFASSVRRVASICLVLAAVALAAQPATGSPKVATSVDELLRNALGRPTDPAELKKRIKDGIARTKGKEQLLLKQLLLLVERTSRPNISVDQMLIEAAKFLRWWANVESNDAGVQVKVAATLFALATTGGPGPTAAGLRKESLERYIKLTKRFPTNIKVHFGLAHAAFYGKGDMLVGLRAAKRCLELKPKHDGCTKIRKWLRESYQQPFCRVRDLRKGLTVHRAWAARRAVPGGVAVKPLKHAGATIHMQRQPHISVAQIARGVQGKYAVLELRPNAVSKLEALRVWGPDDRVVLMRGKHLVTVATYNPLYDNGLAFMIRFASLCKKVTQRRLPAKL